MTSIRSLLIIIALSVIAVSLIMPFYSYNISALKSHDCPKYCDGCCVTTKPKNATGIGTITPEGAKSANSGLIQGPITGDNQKSMVRNNSGPTPPPCPPNGPIPPNCTMKPFPNATLAIR
ncbi:MAG: hypothetical protein WBP64_00150 [Nitrososphaeraceae archaeon]|jgi:hypothetical protein